MRRFDLMGLAGAILGVFFWVAPHAHAQDRPTLERIEAVMCAQSDEQGQGYRPVFCDPRCDCVEAPGRDIAYGYVTAIGECEQQPDGRVRVVLVAEPHDVLCVGFCAEFGLAAVPCTTSSPGCTCNAEGGVGVCWDFGLDVGCTVDADCDQAAGFECSATIYGPAFCVHSTHVCSALGEVCAPGAAAPVEEYLFEYAPGGSLTPLACSAGGNINSTDAAECIAQAEAELGAGACIICGDGNLDAGEQCDDGNLTAGDGCAADCTNEP